MSERLTEKAKITTSDGMIDTTYDTSLANIIELPHLVEGQRYTGNAIFKLGQLEDLEEKLGIGLVTLFKALKEGFVDENEEYHHFSNLFIDDIEIFDSYEKISFYLKDYGKTWALTKEELEND